MAAAVFLEGDPDYDSNRGFVSAASVKFLRPSLRIPEPAFQVAALSRYESRPPNPPCSTKSRYCGSSHGSRSANRLKF